MRAIRVVSAKINFLKLCLLISFLGIHATSSYAQPRTEGELRIYMFGHSLVHDGQARSAVPYWMYQLARAEGRAFNYAGAWGFLPQHATNVPPIANWYFDGAPSFWDEDMISFADAEFNAILVTPANFSQWQGPTVGGGDGSPVENASRLVDWVNSQEPGVKVYIYESWPDMGPYLANDFPPSAAEFDRYNAYTLGEFTDWFDAFEDALKSEQRGMDIETISVGPIIAKMHTETRLLDGIPVTDLYRDDAPHGTQTTYFLASLITYAAMYDVPPPSGINVPNGIHPTIKANYTGIADFIASELGVN